MIIPSLFLSWLFIALLFLLFEMSSPGLFYFLSFFFASCITGLCSLFITSFNVQVGVFVITAPLVFWVLRLWVKDQAKVKKTQHTNVAVLTGKHGIVVYAIQAHGMGQVKIGSEVWAARSIDNVDIALGREVEVLMLQGAHVVVKELTNYE